MKSVFLILVLWNLLVFLLYGLDKFFAVQRGRRISEAALLGASLCMGALGAVLGMIVWNHKTKKLKFRIVVPLFLLLQLILIDSGIHWF